MAAPTQDTEERGRYELPTPGGNGRWGGGGFVVKPETADTNSATEWSSCTPASVSNASRGAAGGLRGLPRWLGGCVAPAPWRFLTLRAEPDWWHNGLGEAGA
ncbi:hypothetical protein NDU88_008646 [Pleurodeles waltl]|uniref:Uncharacterized protein n=1 Tax=Pleurodeles waltl TaxID=8319 RepID=A0AAV7QQH7_PLEWA|nr:hypothetical protein NDU88_008646 [Pleurodeles waltl]